MNLRTLPFPSFSFASCLSSGDAGSLLRSTFAPFDRIGLCGSSSVTSLEMMNFCNQLEWPAMIMFSIESG